MGLNDHWEVVLHTLTHAAKQANKHPAKHIENHMESPVRTEAENMAVRAAWMSFVGGLTQSEIARRLNVSPAKAHRLIIQARDEGLIKVSVTGRPLVCLEIEQRLCEIFSLKSCTVSPFLSGHDQSDEVSIKSVGHTAGPILSGLISDPKISKIGVGMGRTLTAGVGEMNPVARQDLSIFSITGSLTTNLAANPYDIVLQLMNKTGGEGFLLPVPYLTSSLEEKNLFLAQPGVRQLLERSAQADLYLIGVGSLEKKGHLVANGLISSAETDALLDVGVVCDLMGSFIDLNGQTVQTDIAQQGIGVPLESMRGKRVFALAGGKYKAIAMLAALRSGIISDLIIDEVLAVSLNGLLNQADHEEPPLNAMQKIK